MQNRLKRLASLIDHYKVDAFLVTKDINITYLCDFPAQDAWLLVTRKKAFYITDARYYLEVKKNIKGVVVKCCTKGLTNFCFDVAQAQAVKRIGFDDRHVSLALFKKLQAQSPKGIRLSALSNFVEQLREIKEIDELRCVRKALSIHADMHKFIKRIVKPGIIEADILLKCEKFVKARKASFSFDPIIASGPNSSVPHATITRRKILKNDQILFDMGVDVKGYKTDLTRIVFLGKITPLVRRVYEIVQVSQKRAIAKIKAEVLASEIDKEARNYIQSNKFGKFFSHALGHGVGLEVHESPRLSGNNYSSLKENMLLTIEPAIYLPNKFGIRIEDMILVKKEGCEVLSGNIN